MPTSGPQRPRVLHSSSECRLIVLELRGGEALADHRVRERAVLVVISGQVSIETAGVTALCGAGTVATFDPGERHALMGVEDAQLLLMLAPWPAAGHYAESDAAHLQRLPLNATVPPEE